MSYAPGIHALPYSSDGLLRRPSFIPPLSECVSCRPRYGYRPSHFMWCGDTPRPVWAVSVQPPAPAEVPDLCCGA